MSKAEPREGVQGRRKNMGEDAMSWKVGHMNRLLYERAKLEPDISLLYA